MLPSTFQDSLKREEDMKRELKMRLALAGFLQDTLQEMARHKKDVASSTEQRATAEELVDFIDRAKHGETLRTEDVTRLARFFKDELTLDNIPRPQLVTLCRYMGLRPYGADGFLRFQLRTKLNSLKEDDRRILWEGLDSLNKLELQEACRERGMRATGLTTEGYRQQLQQWLDLSINKSVPISLLIMSRAFTLESREFQPEEVLRDSISSMDDDVINEVVLDAASREEADTPELRKRRLESIEFQNEMIEDERELARKAAEEKAKAVWEKRGHLQDALRVAEEIRRLERMMNKPPAHVLAQQYADAQRVGDVAEGEQPRVDASGVRSVPEVLRQAAATQQLQQQPQQATAAAAATAASSQKASTDGSAPVIKSLAVLPAPERERGAKPLSLAEMQAISELAQPSSVEAERMQLAMMKAMMRSSQDEEEYHDISLNQAPQPDELTDEQKQFEIDLALADISEELRQDVLELESMVAEKEKLTAQQEALKQQAVKPETEDPNVARMRKMLVSMLNKLESRIEKAESAIGDKLRLLDKDRDGVLDAQELREVVHHALKRHATEEEAEAIVSMLDKDSDGKGK
jgi:LETM1 and EF-hand domain-containing protein 1